MDYSSELWIAFHDEDAQNARLAQHIWEDNGLDVPDTFIPYLLPFLGTLACFICCLLVFSLDGPRLTSLTWGFSLASYFFFFRARQPVRSIRLRHRLCRSRLYAPRGHLGSHRRPRGTLH